VGRTPVPQREGDGVTTLFRFLRVRSVSGTAGGLGFGFSSPDQKDGAVKHGLGFKPPRVFGALPALGVGPKVVPANAQVSPGNGTVLDPSCRIRPGRSADAQKNDHSKLLTTNRIAAADAT